MKLRDAVPQEFHQEFMDTPAARLLDVEIVTKHRGDWPGRHKNVCVWWTLADGHCVGWNENPSRGWSFTIRRCS